MNHGYCKNCWWWKCENGVTPPSISKDYRAVWETLNNKPFPMLWGGCYMQLGENQEHRTREDCWCPDYVNRKKEEKKSGTLEDWLKTINKNF